VEEEEEDAKHGGAGGVGIDAGRLSGGRCRQSGGLEPMELQRTWLG
jgi:hypothetical protein